MTDPLKFFKIDDSTIYQDGFTYSFHRILDPSKLRADLQLRQSFYCSLREEHNCRSRCHVTGNWEVDKKGRKFMLGIIKKGDHTHVQECRDTTPKLRFYKSDDDESIYRNGFVYSLNRELDPPKQIADFQWHRTYRCSMSIKGQENCQAKIYTTGQWEVNKRELQYQLGIFKNCNHSHESDWDSREEDNIMVSALCSSHTKDLDEKEQIRFYKYKEKCLQHSGFVYSDPMELKRHPAWRQRMSCQRKINGKRICSGYIWTTGKWEEDDRGRKYQVGILVNGHTHEPLPISFQGKDNDDDVTEAGSKFYRYKEKMIYRDGFAYGVWYKLKCRPPWKNSMLCGRHNRIPRCKGYIWSTGSWETDELGRVYQRGILRGGHSHKAYEQFLNEDDTAHVGSVMDDKQSLDEDDVVMIEG